MNAPLPAPALRRQRPNIAIIGAGPGGLAAAMLLAASGARVTVFEKDDVVGGRTRTLTSPEGYRFDLGPTFFLYPRIIREVFASCGADLDEEVELIQLDPQYRLIFEGSPSVTLDATGDLDRMEAAIAAFAPQDAAGVRRFMADNRWKLDAFRPVLEKPFSTTARMLGKDVLLSLPQLRPHLQVDEDLRRYFSDPRVRLAFSFQTKYLGMSPFKCPSMFTILSFLEYEYGVYHPVGGCGAVSEAMRRVAERLGVEFRLATPVERIAFAGRRAVGVEAGGRHHAADALVLNGDFAHAVPRLVPDSIRRAWSDRKIAKARYSCSTFMLYLGVEGALPQLAHHNVLLSERYEENIREIETGVLPQRPSLYVQNPVATDPGMAPPGHSAVYILVPVPNLRHGTDWAAEKKRFRDLAIGRLQVLGVEDIESRIRYERIVSPQSWHDDYAVGFGATFNLSHDLLQMLSFRPRNRFNDTEGLYLVGGGTHPGSGLPVIYEGARITARLILEDLAMAPGAVPALAR
ncbi:MAG: phytoene desaturase family protein [Roseococcus sp.]|nr:phytoene desaturase family protein [Roseococcus sp.]